MADERPTITDSNGDKHCINDDGTLEPVPESDNPIDAIIGDMGENEKNKQINGRGGDWETPEHN